MIQKFRFTKLRGKSGIINPDISWGGRNGSVQTGVDQGARREGDDGI